MPRKGTRASRERREHERKLRVLRRVRFFVGALGFIPIGCSIACADTTGGVCLIPWDHYFLVWAVIIGAFIGLTMRIARERRTFERAQR